MKSGFKPVTIVFKVSDNIKEMMIKHYEDMKCEKTPPYALFQVKDFDCVTTLYESGKVMFQGTSADVDAAMNYMLIKQKKDFVWNMLSMMWMSVANTAIAQAQDILELDDKARMNIPSTSSGNWMWRAKKGVFTDELAEKVAKYTRRYGRSNKN